MNTLRIPISSAVAALLIPAVSFAAGFQINEHNAASTGRAGAVFATVKDASSVFFNPAGLVHTKGTEAQLGVTVIRPSGSYTGPGYPSTRPAGATGDVTQSAESPFLPVPNAYLAHALSDKAFVGLGVYLPYGLTIAWEDPDNFVGRTLIEEQSLRTLFITPAIALKLSDAVAVAVSVSLVPASVFLRRTIGASDNGQVLFPKSTYGSEGKIELSGSAFGVGANAGVQLTLFEHLKLGASYRSAVGLNFDGKVDFQVPETVPAPVRRSFPDGDINGEINLPHAFSAGIGWEQGALTVEAAANLTLWSSYKELRINFETDVTGDGVPDPSPASVSKRDWVNAATLRLGGQYAVLDWLTARLGVAYDFTPVPDETLDPTLPDGDRIAITGGVGFDFGVITADLAYMGLIIGERDGSASKAFAPGVYEARRIDLVGLSVGAKF